MNFPNLILRGNIHYLQNGLGRIFKLFPINSYKLGGLRTLYEPSLLRLDKFNQQNLIIKEKYGDTSLFLTNLERFEIENTKIFPEDIEVLIALCENDKNLIGKTIKLTKRYFDQPKDRISKPFIFGPHIMRLLYIHDAADEALQLFLDEEYGKFFTQTKSYVVLMDKLFKIGRFEEVKFLMRKFMSEKGQYDFPVSLMTLFIGANYKIGTEEALEDAKQLIHLKTMSGKKVPFRCLTFAAGLALKLGKISDASKFLKQVPAPKHYLVSNLMMLVKARTGCIEDALTILISRAYREGPVRKDKENVKLLCYEVFEEVEKIIMESEDVDNIKKIKDLRKVFETKNLINYKTLDESLCEPVIVKIDEDEVFQKWKKMKNAEDKF